jgi:hypothetical protein
MLSSRQALMHVSKSPEVMQFRAMTNNIGVLVLHHLAVRWCHPLTANVGSGADSNTSCIGQLQIDWLGLVMEPLRMRLDANLEIQARIQEYDKLRFDFDATNAELER